MRRVSCAAGCWLFLVPLVVGCGRTTSIGVGPAASAAVGSALPPIEVEGWINGGPVTNADLTGKVAVIDCFAWW